MIELILKKDDNVYIEDLKKDAAIFCKKDYKLMGLIVSINKTWFCSLGSRVGAVGNFPTRERLAQELHKYHYTLHTYIDDILVQVYPTTTTKIVGMSNVSVNTTIFIKNDKNIVGVVCNVGSYWKVMIHNKLRNDIFYTRLAALDYLVENKYRLFIATD